MTSHEMLDQLLLMWRDTQAEMDAITAPLYAQINVIQQEITEITAQHKEELKDLEVQIKPLVTQRGSTYSEVPGVVASYRKGYNRVSYDAKQTDMVLGFLRDVLPNAAEQLEKARKENAVAPSVSVKVKEGR